jgi:hypothetical protein
MPPVVGKSDAVIPTRITLSADAPPTGTLLRKAATASHPKLGRQRDLVFLDTAIPPVVQSPSARSMPAISHGAQAKTFSRSST